MMLEAERKISVAVQRDELKRPAFGETKLVDCADHAVGCGEAPDLLV